MDISQFKASLAATRPEAGLSIQLQSLWYDGKDDWRTAHDLIDQLTDRSSALIHAYLHRKEDDIWNADYWYSRAQQKRPDISLDEEWEQLVTGFLS